MKEYIERDALKEAFKSVMEDRNCPMFISAEIEQILDCASAADVVEVVRCAQCKHWEQGACLKIFSDGAASKYAWQFREGEDFCSYGERREENAVD